MPSFSSWTCDLNTALQQGEECLAGWEQSGLRKKWANSELEVLVVLLRLLRRGGALFDCRLPGLRAVCRAATLGLFSANWLSSQERFLVRCLHVWFGFNVDFYIKENQFYSNWKARCVQPLRWTPESPSCRWQSVAGFHTPLDVPQRAAQGQVCVSSTGDGPFVGIKLQQIFQRETGF